MKVTIWLSTIDKRILIFDTITMEFSTREYSITNNIDYGNLHQDHGVQELDLARH